MTHDTAPGTASVVDELDLYSEDLKSLDVDPTPDTLSAAMTSTKSSFSCVGSISTATCAATTGTVGCVSSF